MAKQSAAGVMDGDAQFNKLPYPPNAVFQAYQAEMKESN